MNIIKPYYEILTDLNGEEILKHLELCGRVCYKSEERITEGSAEKFLRAILARGHEAVLEHYSFTVRFVVDRGISHEIVRHRLASYCQESSRYCNYTQGKFGGEITVIQPPFFAENSMQYYDWRDACQIAENRYFSLLNSGAKPEEARDVLPTSLKTELVMTANVREWRTVLKLRCSPQAHPQIRQVMLPLLYDLQNQIPIVFDDIVNSLEKGKAHEN